MDIREIDDRYPEFAEAYEPVKGRKRRKRIAVGALASPFLAAIGSIMIISTAIIAPSRTPPKSGGTGGRERTPTVVVTPTPAPTPTPVTTPEPTPEISPEITPEASPEVTPEESPVVSIAPPDNPPHTTPKPTTTTKPPVSPTPPQEPTVSFSHLNFWEDIGHLEMAYLVTANDATDISAQAEYYYSDGGGWPYTADVSYISGKSQTVTFNFDSMMLNEVDQEDYSTSAAVTLNYTFNGQTKQSTTVISGSPSSQGTLQLGQNTNCEYVDEVMNIDTDLTITAPANYRHDLDPVFYTVEIGWMDSGKNVLSEKRELWTSWGGGDSPFSAPTATTDSSGNTVYTVQYSDGIYPFASGTETLLSARYFFLTFYFGGTATDTEDSMTYDIRPHSIVTGPLPLDGELYPPEVDVDHLWYWGHFQGGGLEIFDFQYSIYPNDAEIVSYDVSLIPSGGNTLSWTGQTATGTVSKRQSGSVADGYYFYTSGGITWAPQFTITYRLDGAETTKVYADFPPMSPTIFEPYFTISRSGTTMTATLHLDSADPLSYSVDVSEVVITWMADDGDDHWHDVDPATVIYPMSGATVTQSGNEYTLSCPGLAYLSPPTGATHFYVSFLTNGYTAGSFSSGESVPTYDSVGFYPVSDLTP